jgi:hypothetical protein
MGYKPCQYDREEYLEYAAIFENVELDDADTELCEFNSDPEDLAFELAYTRYYLAKAEREIELLRKQVDKNEIR